MKKPIFNLVVVLFMALSAVSFVYLNMGNTEFPLFSVATEIKSFDVPSSTLPDVEAVKNTILFIREMLSL